MFIGAGWGADVWRIYFAGYSSNADCSSRSLVHWSLWAWTQDACQLWDAEGVYLVRGCVEICKPVWSSWEGLCKSGRLEAVWCVWCCLVAFSLSFVLVSGIKKPILLLLLASCLAEPASLHLALSSSELPTYIIWWCLVINRGHIL